MKCKHFPQCGGCQFQSLSASDEEAGKRDAFLRAMERSMGSEGLTPEIQGFISSPLYSRRRATLSGKRTKKGAVLGFLEAKTHNIVNMEMCLILREKIFNLRPYLKEMMPMLGSRSSQVKFHITELAHGFDLQIENHKPLQAPQIESLAEIARRAQIERITLGQDLVYFSGSAQLEIGNLTIDAPPHPFLQATKDAEIALRKLAHDAVKSAPKIADLFAGLGTFSYGLTSEVTAFEGDALMSENMQHNLNQLGIHNIKTQKRDLFREPLLQPELNEFDTAIIDPPRAGAKAQCAELANSNLPLIAFISCEPSSFARDAKTLIEGGYKMAPITLIDQFRFSSHIESFTVFSK